jgi:glycosyltransferase involved in cell wall biosynthesis
LRKNEKIPVTVLLAAKNEAVNLPKCLQSLSPAQRVILLDSQSADGTGAIARKLGAQVVQFRYRGGYPKKRQWAMDHLKISTPWVLLIDADEEVPPALWEEIRSVTGSLGSLPAYLIRKEFHFMGKKFRFGGFSFDAVLLFKKGKARFERLVDDPAGALDMEVHERLVVDGPIGRFSTPLIHNDYKDLGAYLDRHNKYSSWESRLRKSFLETGRYGSISPRLFGNAQERRRFIKKIAIQTPLEPFFLFLHHYLFQGGILEGRPGYIACKIRSDHFFYVRAKLYELMMAAKREAASGLKGGSAP